MTVPAYRLLEPPRLTTGAVFNSPHSGNEYPEALLARTRLDRLQLRASEDALIDRLFAPAAALGAPLLAATAPRAWIDLNRGPAELDPALIHGVRTAGLNQRIAAGLGVVPRIVSEGAAIYDGKLTLAEANDRIRTVHAPYHARLEALLMRARTEFGTAILFDCHSMPSDALRAAPRVRGRAPEVVLGDRFGAAATREIVAETQIAFETAGFVVARNAPFAGGYITQRYGRPARGVNAVQIEIDRALYLDQRRIEPNAGYPEIARRIERVIAALCAIAPGLSSLAAE
jgi:N-formylglutamate amidohydrolase